MADEAELKGSEARLWKLIEERARPDSDTEALDQRIWDLFGEDWAVMFTDLAGFSRQVILRIGDSDVFGAEVNAASKLGEDTAQADEILVTGAVRSALGERTDVSLSELSVAVPGARSSFRVEYMTQT
jgi:hypothetical protein